MNEAIRTEYLSRLRAIERDYPYGDAPVDVPLHEHMANIALLRTAARDELREAMRIIAAEPMFGPDEWRYAIAV